SDDGKSSFFRGLHFYFHGTAVAGSAAGGEAFADVVLRDYGRTGCGEGSVSACVVAVIVRVDDEADGFVRDAEILERGLNFFGKGSKLIVHDDDAIFADGGGDVAALTLEHVNVSGNFGDLNLDFRPIGCLFLSRSEGAEKSCGQNCEYSCSADEAIHEDLRSG